MRKGEIGEVVRIDHTLIPPSCDVRMSNGSVVNTEFSFLTKVQVAYIFLKICMVASQVL